MPYILENMTQEDISDVAAIERLCFSLPWPTSAYRRELKTPSSNRYIVARYLSPQMADLAGLPEPSESNLTHLTHFELKDVSSPIQALRQPAVPQPAGISRLTSLLPWRRNGHAEEDEEVHRRFPIVGYAGLWLMVDEAHVTTIGVHPDFRGKGAGELLFLGLADIAQDMTALRLTLEVRVSNSSAQALYRKYGLEIAGVRKRYYSDNGEDAYIMWSEPLASTQYRERLTHLRRELARRLAASYTQDLPSSRPLDPANPHKLQ